MVIGQVQLAQEFPEAHKPAYILTVDFGPDFGVLKTSAQLTQRYTPQMLVGKRVVGVLNFPAKQIGPIQSQFLILGATDVTKGTSLIGTDHDVPLGTRIT